MSILDLLYPKRCPLCGKLTGKSGPCTECEEDIIRIEPPVCQKCGKNKKDCDCGGKRYSFVSEAAPFYYEGAVRRGILLLKYYNRKSSAEYFSDIIAQTVEREYTGIVPEIVTSVPMHPGELRKRGFDPVGIIGKKTAEKLGIKYVKCLRKIFVNEKQHLLPAAERAGNVLGVYEVENEDKFRGRNVLLCDDIFTTGATVDECAKMLRLHGAGGVLCATCAVNKKRAVKGDGQGNGGCSVE